MTLVYIEGNIGAGKSTLMKRLTETYDTNKCLIITEPLKNWPSLLLFYEDKRRYAYQLQTEIMSSFHDRETNCDQTKELYIFERSIRSSMLFGSVNCIDSELEWLKEQECTLGRKDVETHYIYLRTSVDKCFKNIQKRGKPTDGYIDVDYLTIIHDKHDDVFKQNIIDGDQDADNVFADTMQMIYSFSGH